MASATDMVRLLEEALAKNIGVKQVTVDGQTISFESRESMLAELQFWKKQAATAAGRRSLFRGFDLGSAY